MIGQVAGVLGGWGCKEGEVVAKGNEQEDALETFFNVLSSTTMRCSNDYPISWTGSLSKFTYLC